MSATTTTSSTAATAAGPKASMFVRKAGFVIPKNKLSGSLVRISRGGKRAGGQGEESEDNVNQVRRKTRWGLDLTLDTAVRKGRAIAYQTRVDQITEQLQSGTIDAERNQGVANQGEPLSSSPRQIDSVRSELLELEQREAIGEILKLNPSYKAPTNYKPLLKEAKVPIPVKEYPGHSFIGLIFGPENETQKRLEKETGVKIQVYGIKDDAEEEVEVTPTDLISSEVVYKELSICITANTFDKVDEAVAVIELLVASLTNNPAKDDHAGGQSMGTSAPLLAPSEALQASHQDQFQYQGPWIPPMTAQASLGSSFIDPQNHTVRVSSPMVPSLIGSHQPPAPSFSGTPQPTQQPPRNFFGAVPVASSENSISYGQHVPAGFTPNVRPSMPALQHTPSGFYPGTTSNQSFVPTGSSSGWPAFTPTGPSPVHQQGPMAPRMETSQGLLQGVHPIGFPTFKAPPNISSSPSGPSPMTHNAGAFGFASGPHYPMGPSSRPVSIQSPSAGAAAMPPPNLSINPGSAANFTPIRPPTAGDFIFRGHPPPDPNLQRFPRMNIQPAAQNSLLPPSSSILSFRSAMPNATAQPLMFPRPQAGNHINQMPAHMPNTHFAGNPAGAMFPPQFPPFPGSGGPAVRQMQLNNFGSIHPHNLPGLFPQRPMNSLQLQHGSPMHGNPGGRNLVRPTERFINNPRASGTMDSGPRRPQIYDPFSPSAELQHGSNQGKNTEIDPEYEDLMASVGVK